MVVLPNNSNFRMTSCLLKHFTRKIGSKVNRQFDVSNIILKIGIVYVNAKVVVRVENFECYGCIPQCLMLWKYLCTDE